jgi:hypothetical protein
VDAIEVESLVGDWGFEVGAENVYFRLSPPPEKWMQKRLHLWLKIGSSGSSLGALWELVAVAHISMIIPNWVKSFDEWNIYISDQGRNCGDSNIVNHQKLRNEGGRGWRERSF